MLKLQSPSTNGLPVRRLQSTPPERPSSAWHPWLHCWAILTMVVAVIGVVTGSLVTTLRVGMADPDWPTTPWQLFTTPWSEKSFGYLVEHMHRLADYATGIFVIGLTVGTWTVERRTWVRVLGIVALVGVIAQGALGGLRVLYDFSFGTQLRIVHGCAAHLFLALLGVLALVTSRGWYLGGGLGETSKRLRLLAVLLAATIYMQAIFGAVLRHTEYAPLAQRGHLLFAMAVVGMGTWLVLLLRSEGGMGNMKKLIYAFKGLLLLQVLLGVETWLNRFRSGLFADLQPISNGEIALRTAHLLVGSLLFASSVMIAVAVYRSVLLGS